MEWINVEDRLPKLSYVESDNQDDPYESYPILVYSPESPGIMCVASLIQEQNEKKWSFGEYRWEVYIPGGGGSIDEVDFETFTHWIPLPEPPLPKCDKDKQ